jgi:hypothetical protein
VHAAARPARPADVDAPVHRVLSAVGVVAAHDGHGETLLVRGKVEPDLVVARGHHVRHARRDALDLAQKDVPVAHVTVRVADVAVVEHQVELARIDESLELCDGAVGVVGVAHVPDRRHAEGRRVRARVRGQRLERPHLAPALADRATRVAHAVVVKAAGREPGHRRSVQHAHPAEVGESVRAAVHALALVAERRAAPLHRAGGRGVARRPADAHLGGLPGERQVHLLRRGGERAARHVADTERRAPRARVPRERADLLVTEGEDVHRGRREVLAERVERAVHVLAAAAEERVAILGEAGDGLCERVRGVTVSTGGGGGAAAAERVGACLPVQWRLRLRRILRRC